MEFFTYAFEPQYAYSIWMYNAIFIVTTVFAFLSNSKSKTITSKTRVITSQKTFFCLSFFCAWIFFAFSSTGSDLAAYVSIFEDASFSESFFSSRTMEKGYLILNVILHKVIQSPYLGIALIKTVLLLLVWGGIYSLRNQIHIGFAVMAYMALFYFQNFNLLRIGLAGSICFTAFIFLIRNKKTSAIVIAVVAITIHRSALLFLLTFFVYFIYRLSRRMKLLYRILINITVPILAFLSKDIILQVIESGLLGERYSVYQNIESTVGYAQFAFYLPVFLILYYLNKDKSTKPNKLVDMGYIWACAGFIVALSGYGFGILARAAIFFSPVFSVLVPYYMKCRQNRVISPSRKRLNLSYRVISLAIACYWVLRYILTISSLFIPSGLYEYKMF